MRSPARAGWRRVKRFLRSPAVIIGEIATITVAAILGAVVPQQGTASLAELARLRTLHPVASALVNVLDLDDVFRSAWFLSLALLTSASLSIVVAEQVRRLRLAWSQRPTEAQMRAAPFHVEFERASARPTVEGAGARRVDIRTSGRLGLAGSAVFHGGLLLLIVAAALRALFGVDAVVDLIEGERLPPVAEAWAAQRPGVLAAPFRLAGPLSLEAVKATRYESGALRDLTVRVSLDGERGVRHEEIAVNGERRVAGGRLFLGLDFGSAALLEWRANGIVTQREAILLAGQGKGVYVGSTFGPPGLRAYLRAVVDPGGDPPDRLDVRVTRFMGQEGIPLLFGGVVRVGEEVSLPGGYALKLHGLPFWARLRGNRDQALPLAYGGFALALAGATMMFGVVKVDACVIVTRVGDRERVFVALRPQRFAPLFQERFARLVREQGGPA